MIEYYQYKKYLRTKITLTMMKLMNIHLYLCLCIFWGKNNRKGRDGIPLIYFYYIMSK